VNEQPFKRFHWLALFTTGMGVFTDGYDLASIGLVLPLVSTSFGVAKITGLQSGMLAGSVSPGGVARCAHGIRRALWVRTVIDSFRPDARPSRSGRHRRCRNSLDADAPLATRQKPEADREIEAPTDLEFGKTRMACTRRCSQAAQSLPPRKSARPYDS